MTLTVPVRAESDVAMVRIRTREVAGEAGLSAVAAEAVVIAASEIARNIVVHAGAGEVTLSVVAEGARRGVEVVARDNGPGIQNVALALEDGYSSRATLGLGLPGARRLVHDFDIVSGPGGGTVVTMKKWA